jgi:membrane-associated phospholipid phosphatase
MNSGPVHDAETRARWHVAALLAVGLGATALAIIIAVVDIGEGHVLHLVTSHRAHWTIAAGKGFTRAGSLPVLILLGLLAAAVVYWWTRRIAVALSPMAALLVAVAVTKGGKALIGRARPPVDIQLVLAGGNSTPSGHATESTALLVAIALVIAMIAWAHPLVGRVACILAVLVAIGVGLSRLELGVHWPLDVVAGWLLGLGVAIGAVAVGVALDGRFHQVTPPKKEQAVLV